MSLLDDHTLLALRSADARDILTSFSNQTAYTLIATEDGLELPGAIAIAIPVHLLYPHSGDIWRGPNWEMLTHGGRLVFLRDGFPESIIKSISDRPAYWRIEIYPEECHGYVEDEDLPHIRLHGR